MDRPVTTECLMTTRAVARFLCVVPKTVHRWRRRRGLPAFRVSRSAIRYDRHEIHCWLDRRRAQRPHENLICPGRRAKGGRRR
ncbi:MAG: helix-turn-helix domain-containing protein [Candidatus Rokubacteria bacterium]|nr:helix-turn-helix domain-containing protein [Candidatus Rokubacteria bacterium]